LLAREPQMRNSRMVCQCTAGPDADGCAGRAAPAFTAEENGMIAAWSDAIQRRGLRIETNSRFHASLDEVLLVFPHASDEPAWLLHKTPAGAVAVRWWPGVAQIVATVAEALAIIAAGADAADG